MSIGPKPALRSPTRGLEEHISAFSGSDFFLSVGSLRLAVAGLTLAMGFIFSIPVEAQITTPVGAIDVANPPLPAGRTQFGLDGRGLGPSGEGRDANGGKIAGMAFDGRVDWIVVANPNDRYSACIMSVANNVVIVPANMILFLPANFMTCRDLVAQTPLPEGFDGSQASGANGVAIETAVAGSIGSLEDRLGGLLLQAESNATAIAALLDTNGNNVVDIAANDLAIDTALKISSVLIELRAAGNGDLASSDLTGLVTELDRVLNLNSDARLRDLQRAISALISQATQLANSIAGFQQPVATVPVGPAESGFNPFSDPIAAADRLLASVVANQMDDLTAIAGEVFIDKGVAGIPGAGPTIENQSGTVTFINRGAGYLCLNGRQGQDCGTSNEDTLNAGAMIRLNDPESRHSIQSGVGCREWTNALGETNVGANCSPDPRFTNDPDNYTNSFATGYPYCIPTSLSDFCPEANRPGGANVSGQVPDAFRFSPILVGDGYSADGFFTTEGGVKFFSAHTTSITAAITTSESQPGHLIWAEVEMDQAGFQNQRIKHLLIGFTSDAASNVWVFGNYKDYKTGEDREFLRHTTLGCEQASNGGLGGLNIDVLDPIIGTGVCTQIAIPQIDPATGGFIQNAGGGALKIRYDVDFINANLNATLGGNAVARDRFSPCAHLNSLTDNQLAQVGLSQADNPCSEPKMTPALDALGTPQLDAAGAQVLVQETDALGNPIFEKFRDLNREFMVGVPVAREWTGKTLARMRCEAGMETPVPGPDNDICDGPRDINGRSVNWGLYLTPIAPGHPEMEEIDLARFSTPFIFGAQPWLLDRRLGPVGHNVDINGENIHDLTTLGAYPLLPFPYSGLDACSQALVPFEACEQTVRAAIECDDPDPITKTPGGNCDQGGSQNFRNHLVNSGGVVGSRAADLGAGLAEAEIIGPVPAFRPGREVVFANGRTRLRFQGPTNARFDVCLDPAGALTPAISLATDLRLTCVPLVGAPCVGAGTALIEFTAADIQGLVGQDTFLSGDTLFIVDPGTLCEDAAADPGALGAGSGLILGSASVGAPGTGPVLPPAPPAGAFATVDPLTPNSGATVELREVGVAFSASRLVITIQNVPLALVNDLTAAEILSDRLTATTSVATVGFSLKIGGGFSIGDGSFFIVGQENFAIDGTPFGISQNTVSIQLDVRDPAVLFSISPGNFELLQGTTVLATGTLTGNGGTITAGSLPVLGLNVVVNAAAPGPVAPLCTAPCVDPVVGPIEAFTGNLIELRNGGAVIPAAEIVVSNRSVPQRFDIGIFNVPASFVTNVSGLLADTNNVIGLNSEVGVAGFSAEFATSNPGTTIFGAEAFQALAQEDPITGAPFQDRLIIGLTLLAPAIDGLFPSTLTVRSGDSILAVFILDANGNALAQIPGLISIGDAAALFGTPIANNAPPVNAATAPTAGTHPATNTLQVTGTVGANEFVLVTDANNQTLGSGFSDDKGAITIVSKGLYSGLYPREGDTIFLTTSGGDALRLVVKVLALPVPALGGGGVALLAAALGVIVRIFG